jgi:hypothetical protein
VRRESTSLSHPKVLGKMRHEVTLFIRNIEMGDHCGLNLTAYHRFTANINSLQQTESCAVDFSGSVQRSLSYYPPTQAPHL